MARTGTIDNYFSGLEQLKYICGQIPKAELGGHIIVHLDFFTLREIEKTRPFEIECRVHQGRPFPAWRGMEIMVHSPKRPMQVGSSCEMTSEPYRDPFCMYIEIIQENGRRRYIDHPDTDECYL